MMKIISFILFFLLSFNLYAKTGSVTGLEIPRYVSLKSNEVNLRVGPSTNYPIELMYITKNLPVEVIDEFDAWRKINDHKGKTGWLHKSLIQGDRFVLTGYKNKNDVNLFNRPNGSIIGIIKKNNILKILREKKNKILQRDFNIISKLCMETLKTKIFFFKNDVYEKKNRLILNFGHTFAHAIEMTTEKMLNKEYLRHGEAVGLGILCELYYSNGKENSLQKKILDLLKNYNLPIKIIRKNLKINKQQLNNSIYKNLFLDKKKISRHPRYIFMKKIYKPSIKELSDENLILQTIDRFIG